MDMFVTLISMLRDNISVTYCVSSDNAANRALKVAFEDKAPFDGVSYKIEPYASRKSVFIPAITKVLESYSGK